MFEMEIVDGPDLSKLNWAYDSGRGRVLVRTGRRVSDPPAITVRVTADGTAAKPPSANYQHASIELDDGRGRAETAYFEDLNEDPIIDWWFDVAQDEPGGATREFTYRFDREEILGQYQDGEWSDAGISPGQLTVRFAIEEYAVAEATTTLDVPEDAKVRDNVRVADLDIDVQNGQTPTITPTATIENPADHGVDYPIQYTVRADGRQTATEAITIENLSGTTSRRDPEVSTATLPSVTLPTGTQDATVFIEPRDWAAAYGETYSESVSPDAPVPTDVQIVDCDIAQSRVTPPAEVEMSATLENPAPFRVTAEASFSLGAESRPETVTLDPGERYTISQRVPVFSQGVEEGSVSLAVAPTDNPSAREQGDMADCGTVEVLAAFDSNSVELTGCNVSPSTITAGDTVTATVTVRNNNSNNAARATVNFTAPGASTSDTVTVQAGRTATARAEFVFESSGSYNVDASLGSVSQA